MTAPAIPRQPSAPLAPDEVLDLIKAAQAGSSDAFGRLYDAFVCNVYAFVMRRIGGDRYLAEDITSDTFLRALRALPRWEPRPGGFQAWLYTIARNIVMDHFKSSRYRSAATTFSVAPTAGSFREYRDDVGGGGMNHLPALDIAADPAELTEAYLQRREVAALVLELTGDQREVLILRFWQQLSVAETATLMGRNEGAIKALQYRATATLARLVRDRGLVLR